MQKDVRNFILAIAAVLILITVVVLVKINDYTGFNESNAWLCKGDEWIKIGNPSTPMPSRACGSTPFANSTPNNLQGNSDIEGRREVGLRVLSPLPGEKVKNIFEIKGEARGGWYFEASFPIEIIDSKGVILATSIAKAKGDWMRDVYVPFDAEVTLTKPSNGPIYIVFKNDNPSGLPEHDMSFKYPVVVNEKYNHSVKVFFNNNLKSSGSGNCSDVFAVERAVIETKMPARQALEELLNGVTKSEELAGFSTQINSGVKINSLNISNNVAYVDFSKKMGEAVAGSCRVGAIRAQIEKTLLQFSQIKEVVISIDGDSKEILQP